MSLRPFSEHQRGLFVSVDGPSGAGKSTIVQHLAQLLVAAGEEVHVTVFLWRLNAEADRPDLAVILEADPEVISEGVWEAIRSHALSQRESLDFIRRTADGRWT